MYISKEESSYVACVCWLLSVCLCLIYLYTIDFLSAPLKTKTLSLFLTHSNLCVLFLYAFCGVFTAAVKTHIFALSFVFSLCFTTLTQCSVTLGFG